MTRSWEMILYTWRGTAAYDLPPEHVPHLKLEFYQFLFLNADMPLVLEGGNSKSCVA